MSISGLSVLFLHDTDENYIGGAELSNKKIIEVGRSLGYQIICDSLKNFNLTRQYISQSDLIILSSTYFCSYQDKLFDYLIKSNIPYVCYEHDYGFCALRNLFCKVKKEVRSCCDSSKYKAYQRIFSKSLINVFLSPTHFKLHHNFFGESVGNHFLLPPPLSLEYINNSIPKLKTQQIFSLA